MSAAALPTAQLTALPTVALHALARLHLRWATLRIRRDRGDVPGWVLITLMTAGLVTALWAVAQPKLTALFTSAVDSVTSGQ